VKHLIVTARLDSRLDFRTNVSLKEAKTQRSAVQYVAFLYVAFLYVAFLYVAFLYVARSCT